MLTMISVSMGSRHLAMLLGPAVALLTACGGHFRPLAVPTPPGSGAPTAQAGSEGWWGEETPNPRPILRGRLAGHVRSAAGKPIVRARVIVENLHLHEKRVALTSEAGTYEISELAGGQYAISVMKAGYVVVPGQSVGRQATIASFTLIEGEPTLIDLLLRESPPPSGPGIASVMAPNGSGVLTGQIRDEDDTPLAAAVDVFRPGPPEDMGSLAPVASVHTNDRGQFRIEGLSPGSYYVSAIDLAFADATDAGGVLRFAPTYHPGVVDPLEARPVRIESAHETRTVDFRVRLTETGRIHGTLDANGDIGSASVELIALGSAFGAPPASVGRILPDGTFVFSNVPPGRYLIRASAEPLSGGSSVFGWDTVKIDGPDAKRMRLQLQPGATVSGKVSVDTSLGMWNGPRLRVVVLPADGQATAGIARAPVQLDGTFSLEGVLPGPKLLRLEGLPAPWSLMSVFYQDRDLTDAPLSVGSDATVEGVRLRITDRSSSISGLVLSDQGMPVPDSAVVVFPTDRTKWRPDPRQMGASRTEADGRFYVVGLAAGEYLVAADTDLLGPEIFQPETLSRLEQHARRIILGDGAHVEVDLRESPGSSSK